MQAASPRRLYAPYHILLGCYALFLVFALMLDSPARILQGMWAIITSRGILITDYVELGGIGATLVNAALVGAVNLLFLVRHGVKPNGSIIMALWMTTGFAFFGKNLFNMLPLTLGVWFFSKFQREPFVKYALVSLLCSTLSPVVGEIAFMGASRSPWGMLWGVAAGIFVGFIFAPISSFTLTAHMGYCLYNMGVAGGLIATLIVSVMNSLNLTVKPELIWSTRYSLELAVLNYLISAALVALGLVLSDRKMLWHNLLQILRQPGRLVTDFYLLYHDAVYINMGVLCALSTTILLAMGGSLNGPTVGGILTITAFGSFGKHPRNVLPIMAGAVLSTYFNHWDLTSPSNTLAILFSTGLAPIAGQFGWLWGIVAGFVHVNMAHHVVNINSGLNLYNNGFAGGLVAMLLVPLILAFRREPE